MSYPNYFARFPNINYALSVNKAGQPTYVQMKDFFRLLRVREDIFKEDTLFYNYIIESGKRPEIISYEEYGDEQYYWIILQINNIIDFYNEWPLSSYEFEKFILKKYGSYESAGAIRHYETQEVKLPDGTIILPGKIVVPKGYIYPYNVQDNQVVLGSLAPVSVSYFEYENRLNDKKKHINILKSKYLIDYIRDVESFAKSLPSQSSEIDISDYIK